MEIIISLILVTMVVILLAGLTGKGNLGKVFGRHTSGRKDVADRGVEQEQGNAVFDGMITVEIPIQEPQEVAYEPVLPHGEDSDIEIVERPDRVSSA